MSSTHQQRLSIGRLFVEQRGRLLQYLRKQLANDEDAREFVQEAYLRMLRMERLDLVCHPEAYLYRIARNLVHERFAGKKQMETCSLDELDALEETELAAQQSPSPEEAAHEHRRMASVEQALATVSPACREALLLYWRDGLKQQEIAERLNLSRSMVQKHLTKGLAQCQKWLRNPV